jgi:restriction endonuclease S subunit
MTNPKYEFLKFLNFYIIENWSASPSISLNTAFGEEFNVKLGKLITPIRDNITIEDNKKYTRITIRQYGQGVYPRDTVLGADIGTKMQFTATEGQLIVSGIDARNGSIGIVPKELTDAVVTNDFWLFDISDKVVPQYLSLLLSSERFQRYWQSKSSGTTNRQRINKTEFLEMEIPLPNIETQQELVNTQNASVLEVQKLEMLVAEMLQDIKVYVSDILGIKVSPVSKAKLFDVIRYSNLSDWGIGYSKTKTVESNNFMTVSVDTLCSVSSGGTPSRNRDDYFKGHIPWVKTGEVQDRLIWDTDEKITEEALDSSSAKLYPADSIIVAMYGHTRGKTAKLAIDATTNQACAVLYDIDNSRVLTDYLWLYMQTEYDRLRDLAVGSAQPNLNAAMIKGYPVVLPPLDVQNNLVEKFFSVQEASSRLRSEVVDLRNFAKTQFEENVFGRG